jgi:transposase
MLGRERLLGAEVFLHTGVTDMRCGMDRLSSKVSEEFNRSVMTGGLYVFLSRCHRKVKVLYWDRDGYALWMKRLEAGVFRVEKRAGELVEVESHTRIVRRGRKPLPDNLPRHRIEYPPETTTARAAVRSSRCLMARSPRSSSSRQLSSMSTSMFA